MFATNCRGLLGATANRKLHRSAFTPPPKVMSAIVHVIPTEAPEGVSARILERLTEAAFGQRRKMLRQSLKSLPGGIDALASLEIDPTRRAGERSDNDAQHQPRHARRVGPAG